MFDIDNITRLLRRNFPYGLFLDVTGKVVFFNREYEVITFGGKKEFDFNPDALVFDYTYVAYDRYLFTKEGDAYFGKMYFLCDDINPYYYSKKGLIVYLHRIEKLLDVIVGKIGNPYNDSTITDEMRTKYLKKVQSTKG